MEGVRDASAKDRHGVHSPKSLTRRRLTRWEVCIFEYRATGPGRRTDRVSRTPIVNRGVPDYGR